MKQGSQIVASAFIVLATIVGGCTQAPQEASAPMPSNTWAQVRDQLVEDHLRAHPAFAVVAGRHEYDGRLPDWSAAGIAAEVKRLHAARNRALAVTDGELDEASRFERDNFVARMDRDLFWLETAAAPFLSPGFYLDGMSDDLDPAPYLTRNYAPLDIRMRADTKYARSVQQAVPQIRSNLRIPLARPLLERGVSAFRGFADFFDKDVPAIFASVKDPALHNEFREANGAAARSMRGLAEWLESQRNGATASYALGPEKFAKMLESNERVTTPLAQLEAAGRADLERR